MAELLKDRYSIPFFHSLCDEIQKVYVGFNKESFFANIYDEHWDERELKARMGHITQCLYYHLPTSYEKALSILKPVSVKFSGFEPMFFPDYVEQFGLDEYEFSIDALEHFTKYSSSEFAVRPFIIRYPEKMMQQMGQWALSENYHVRRLASEGCRPRLPWAIALPEFKKNPSIILPILEKLKSDETDYVRRSVANNLNDISKDNPSVVVDVATNWLGESDETDKLVKHACRTLLKAGNPDVLSMFGFTSPKNIKVRKLKCNAQVESGKALNFSCEVVSNKKLGMLRVEFAIDFVKANKKTSRKVFKISESDVSENIKIVSKKFSFKPISTRKYYSGKHKLAIIVNGVELAKKSFELK